MDYDTVQRIREIGGMYERADASGSFTLQYQEGVRYVVIMISANQKRSDSNMSLGIRQELGQHFNNPTLFDENRFKVDEYEWSKQLFRHTFAHED